MVPVETTITAEDLSIMSSHETKNRLPASEIGLQINSNVHGLRQAQKIHPDKETVFVHPEKAR